MNDIRKEALKRATMKLLEKLAFDYEQLDILYLDSDLNPDHKIQNDTRIQELEKEVKALEAIFS